MNKLQYDIISPKPPVMPKSSLTMPILKVILSQCPEEMRPLVANGCFAALANQMVDIEFKYPDRTFLPPYVMECAVAHSGAGKSAVSRAVSMIARSNFEHDDAILKERTRQDQELKYASKSKSKGKGKDKEPEVPTRMPMPLWVPDADATRPAIVQNAMDLEAVDRHPMLIVVPEIDGLNQLCGGHKMVSKAIRIFGDGGRWGALRATPDGVTGRPTMRVNISASGTEQTVTEFFRKDLHNGTLWRFGISYLPRAADRKRTIPRQGTYDAKTLAKIDEIVQRLTTCHGKIEIKPLNQLIDSLSGDMADLADLCDSDDIEDMSHRTLTNAWRKGCILYIANGQRWSSSIADFVVWSLYYDVWSKVHLFGELLKGTGWIEPHKGPVANMLDSLPIRFKETDLEDAREKMDKPRKATDQLRAWRNRGFITYDEQTQLYTKTEEYLKNHPQRNV